MFYSIVSKCFVCFPCTPAKQGTLLVMSAGVCLWVCVRAHKRKQ